MMISRSHRNSSKKYLKTEAASFSYLCSVLKSAKMCLLHIKLFSTSRTFRLSKGSIYFFSFSYRERKRERERKLALIKDLEACQWQHITWVGQHLITIFWYHHALFWYQLPMNKSYLRKETPVILNTWVGRMRGGKVWRKEGLSDRENTWSSILSSSCGSP